MEKKERPIDRVKEFVNWVVENDVVKTEIAFERICGFSKHYIKNLCGSEKGNVGVDTIAAIYERFPSINVKWFVTGKGGMFGNRSMEGLADALRSELIEYQVNTAKKDSENIHETLNKVLKEHKNNLTAEEKVALLEKLI